MNEAPRIKIIIKTPDFFATPFKKLVVETDPIINRTYFLKGDRIVAVGAPVEEADVG
jgi:hypothetical protein